MNCEAIKRARKGYEERKDRRYANKLRRRMGKAAALERPELRKRPYR